MKRILIPCNFSVHAIEAIKFALELAVISGGEIFAITVLTSDDADSREKQEEIKARFDQLKQDLETGSIVLSHEVTTGRITSAVLEYIRKENIDLVVMGSHGSRGWNDVFMGSNIEKIVRTSPVPVIAVKRAASAKRIRNIVFPWDLRPGHTHLVEEIKKLQALFGACLHLVCINTNEGSDHSEILGMLEAFAKTNKLENYTVNVWDEYDEKRGIIHFARDINADMIAMSTHGNRDMQNLYADSIAADVVNHANLLVWTCSTREKPETEQVTEW
jgi:nucleotide-binding universal stress UspA family protein